MPRPPDDQVPGEVADRVGSPGPEPARPAPWVDRGGRRVRPIGRVAPPAAPPQGTLRARHPVQYRDTRPGGAAAPTPQEGTWPQAQGPLPAGRRLGEEPAAVAVDTPDRPRCREGPAGSRGDEGPGPNQAES